ncbi:uncharacterized protein At5g39865 [Cicer arietinum]|uniref:Uncharacterized protein At5g39865-like n=1 Tax=Cicer arietinum TaxID=3827 RepID=A0A1S2XRK0_CICAR|nr:uncharacterized protein At5g39865-like [Cicer arietinum]
MGCSASKTTTIVAKQNPEDNNNNNQSPSVSFQSSFSSTTSSSFSSSSYANASQYFNSSPPVRKALSLTMPLVHHLPTKKGDTHHLVSLTSTTYGSLLLIDQKVPNFTSHDGTHFSKTSQNGTNQTNQEQSLSPDSVINTWELMHDLDEDSSHDIIAKAHKVSIFDNPLGFSDKHSSCRYTTFDGSAKKNLLDSFELLKASETVIEKNASELFVKKPLWQHLSEEALLAKLDPSVAWSYRRALSSRQLGSNNNNKNNLFRGVMSMGSSPMSMNSSSSTTCSLFDKSLCALPGTEDRIVVYCTSLRGIRKTYEDCCSVRMILRGFRVVVDERDISMDSSYRKELQNALGGKVVTLPQVFIRGKHVGNAEEMKQLNESGELAKLLKGFPTQESWFVCDKCGDARFVPCPNCNGSRKVFEEEQGKLKRCLHCNENGLIRCTSCCS